MVENYRIPPLYLLPESKIADAPLAQSYLLNQLRHIGVLEFQNLESKDVCIASDSARGKRDAQFHFNCIHGRRSENHKHYFVYVNIYTGLVQRIVQHTQRFRSTDAMLENTCPGFPMEVDYFKVPTYIPGEYIYTRMLGCIQDVLCGWSLAESAKYVEKIPTVWLEDELGRYRSVRFLGYMEKYRMIRHVKYAEHFYILKLIYIGDERDTHEHYFLVLHMPEENTFILSDLGEYEDLYLLTKEYELVPIFLTEKTTILDGETKDTVLVGNPELKELRSLPDKYKHFKRLVKARHHQMTARYCKNEAV